MSRRTAERNQSLLAVCRSSALPWPRPVLNHDEPSQVLPSSEFTAFLLASSINSNLTLLSAAVLPTEASLSPLVPRGSCDFVVAPGLTMPPLKIGAQTSAHRHREHTARAVGEEGAKSQRGQGFTFLTKHAAQV